MSVFVTRIHPRRFFILFLRGEKWADPEAFPREWRGKEISSGGLVTLKWGLVTRGASVLSSRWKLGSIVLSCWVTSFARWNALTRNRGLRDRRALSCASTAGEGLIKAPPKRPRPWNFPFFPPQDSKNHSLTPKKGFGEWARRDCGPNRMDTPQPCFHRCGGGGQLTLSQEGRGLDPLWPQGPGPSYHTSTKQMEGKLRSFRAKYDTFVLLVDAIF